MLDINDIVKIFEEIELCLVQSLKRNLGRHRQEEQDYGMNWSAWQAEKLEGLRKFRQENADIMSQYVDQIDTETRKIMAEQFEEGMNGAVPHGAEQPQFFGVDTVKVNKLIDDVSYLEKNVETAALRCTDDVYRRTVHRAQLAMSTGSMTLQQAIDMAVKDFLDKGINCIEYRDGRRVNIADYVRMALRTTATRAALQGKSERFKALGYDTIQVSKYSMCSDTCLPWQGRVYINDVYTMWDGEVRDHGGIMWGKSNYCGKWFMLLSAKMDCSIQTAVIQYCCGVTEIRCLRALITKKTNGDISLSRNSGGLKTKSAKPSGKLRGFQTPTISKRLKLSCEKHRNSFASLSTMSMLMRVRLFSNAIMERRRFTKNLQKNLRNH